MAIVKNIRLNEDLGAALGMSSLILNPDLKVDGKYSGIVRAGIAGATLVFGDLVHLQATDSRWEKVDANVITAVQGDARGILGICVLAAAADASATKILLWGVVRADAKFPTLTINAPVYISETPGAITNTRPTTANVVIRKIGFGWTADELFFNPDNTFISRTLGTTAERIAYGNTLTVADVGILWSLDTGHKRPYTWDGEEWV